MLNKDGFVVPAFAGMTTFQALGHDSDTMMPTAIITGKDGEILCSHGAGTFFRVLRRHGVVAA